MKKTTSQPVEHPFKYKLGRCQIEAGQQNKAAIRMAWLNTICFWILRIGLAFASANLYNIVDLLFRSG